MEQWRGLYQLPPKDVFFKLLDTRMDLILDNYAVRRDQTWEQILRQAHAPIPAPPTASTDISFQSEKGLPPLKPRTRDTRPPIRRSSANPINRENSYRQIYEADAIPAVSKQRRSSSRRQRPTKDL